LSAGWHNVRPRLNRLLAAAFRAAVDAVPPGFCQLAGERSVAAGIGGGDLVDEGPFAADDDQPGSAHWVKVGGGAARVLLSAEQCNRPVREVAEFRTPEVANGDVVGSNLAERPPYCGVFPVDLHCAQEGVLEAFEAIRWVPCRGDVEGRGCELGGQAHD